MARKAKERSIKPGYREPKTASEQRFWDSYRPDFRKWVRKKRLTIDEMSALAMGLDPASVERIQDEEGQTYARFEATKAYFRDVEENWLGFLPDDLAGVCFCHYDQHLPVPHQLVETVSLNDRGFLDLQKKAEEAERKYAKSQKTITELKAWIADQVVKPSNKSKVRRPSDQKKLDQNTSKIILALAADIMDRKKAGMAEEQLAKLKNGGSTSFSSTISTALQLRGWGMDDQTIKDRIDPAAEHLRNDFKADPLSP